MEQKSYLETRKAQTKLALGRATAGIALLEGSDSITVAKMCAAAGVSVRTFHNYFSSRDEALAFYIQELTQDFCQQVTAAPPELDYLETIEYLTRYALRPESPKTDGIPHVIFLTKQYDQLKWEPNFALRDTLYEEMLDRYHQRYPHICRDNLEYILVIAVQVISAVLLRHFYRSHNNSLDTNAGDIVSKAMATLRSGFEVQFPEIAK